MLHVIDKPEAALSEMARILKPAGVLLLVAPHISMCDPAWRELWRFTEEGLLRLVSNAFGQADISMRSYGNSLTAAGNLRGLSAYEFTRTELQAHDARFASVVCARARKFSSAIPQ